LIAARIYASILRMSIADSNYFGAGKMQKKRGRGRPRLHYNERLLARLPKGTLRRIEAVLDGNEKQADFARRAIASELERREQVRHD
jgi:hypothetical protein